MQPFEQTEYEQTCQMMRFQAQMRLSVLAFVMTVNGSVITICGQRLLTLELSNLALSVVALFSSVLGALFDHRLVVQMRWYYERLCRLESLYGMELFTRSYGNDAPPARRLTGALMVGLFYCAILLFWVVIWVVNLFF